VNTRYLAVVHHFQKSDWF